MKLYTTLSLCLAMMSGNALADPAHCDTDCSAKCSGVLIRPPCEYVCEKEKLAACQADAEARKKAEAEAQAKSQGQK